MQRGSQPLALGPCCWPVLYMLMCGLTLSCIILGEASETLISVVEAEVTWVGISSFNYVYGRRHSVASSW